LGSNWDLFLLTVGIPKDPKGYLSLSTEKVIPHHVEDGVEKTTQEGNTSYPYPHINKYTREGGRRRTRKQGKPDFE
jgi:hypothetical protein